MGSDGRHQISSNDRGGLGWGLLGFFFPLVGLILFLVWIDTKPRNSRAAGKGALVSAILGALAGLLLFVLTLVGVKMFWQSPRMEEYSMTSLTETERSSSTREVLDSSAHDLSDSVQESVSSEVSDDSSYHDAVDQMDLTKKQVEKWVEYVLAQRGFTHESEKAAWGTIVYHDASDDMVYAEVRQTNETNTHDNRVAVFRVNNDGHLEEADIGKGTWQVVSTEYHE